MDPTDIFLNDVDYCNFFYPFKSIFEKDKQAHIIDKNSVAYLNPEDLEDDFNRPTYILNERGTISVMKANPHGIAAGSIISVFMLLSAVRFKKDSGAAMSFIRYEVRNVEVDYVRVGTDYYLIENKPNRYGGSDRTLKIWKKETIKEDHTDRILRVIPKYKDFTIVPDNITFLPVIGEYYNLYSRFPHTPSDSRGPIPTTTGLLRHIFGDQYELGLRYFKLLYQHPKQMLPILVLVSEERETGKTTFINFIQMMFGENSILVNPDNLSSQFNSIYATKNIIMVDETIIEKSATIEKLKSIATAKTMTVNPKYVQGYTIPFYGKLLMATNKVSDFMRVDEQEIRFWVRRVGTISGKKNVNIERDLFAEIPNFLRYLSDLPDIDLSKSRMVFTKEEIGTVELDNVKHESKSSLRKEIEILIEDHFSKSTETNILATASDIKSRWFERDHNYSRAYIFKVLKSELKLPSKKIQRYVPMRPDGYEPSINESPDKLVGKPFIFERSQFVKDELEEVNDESEIF